ncbi:MAG TPA: DUF2283 domain-containing protein [Candidatus Kapabacteria bacterium]|jgi:uncharacterized protein YuzE
MIYNYDTEVDILTIKLRDNIREGEIADSEEFSGGLVAEYGEDGNLIQIELRDVSRLLPQATIVHRQAA